MPSKIFKDVSVRIKVMYMYAYNNTNIQMNSQFNNLFNISLMNLDHLLRFAKQLTISVYEFNNHF